MVVLLHGVSFPKGYNSVTYLLAEFLAKLFLIITLAMIFYVIWKVVAGASDIKTSIGSFAYAIGVIMPFTGASQIIIMKIIECGFPELYQATASLDSTKNIYEAQSPFRGLSLSFQRLGHEERKVRLSLWRAVKNMYIAMNVLVIVWITMTWGHSELFKAPQKSDHSSRVSYSVRP